MKNKKCYGGEEEVAHEKIVSIGGCVVFGNSLFR